MKKWIERFFKTSVIAESDLTRNINQFYYRFFGKQWIYGINGGHQSTKQRHNNKAIKRCYSWDNNIDIYWEYSYIVWIITCHNLWQRISVYKRLLEEIL